MLKKIFPALIIISIALTVIVLLNRNTSEDKTYKVLFISSYHQDFPWVKEIETGIKKAFEEQNLSIDYTSFYMNTKRQPGRVQILSSAEKARTQILRQNPDIVIVSDDNATEYVAAKMKNTKYNFVFCGVNNEPQAYGLPASNITGVLERHRFADAFKILKILVPNTRKIAVLSEKSESSDLIVSQLKEQRNDIPAEIIGVHTIEYFEEWQNLVKDYQNKADALMIVLYTSFKGKAGNVVPEQQVMNWYTSNTKLPDVGLFPFFAEQGGMLADAVNGYSQGYTAAKMAIRILRGEKPLNIGIKTTSDGIIYINSIRTQKLDIKIPPEIYESARIIREDQQNYGNQ